MPAMKAQARQKTAFLTGASSGIGKAAAAALQSAGYRVIGTSRRVEPDAVRDGIRMIPCDVTSDESVAAAVARALETEAFGRSDAVELVGDLPSRVPVRSLSFGR